MHVRRRRGDPPRRLDEAPRHRLRNEGLYVELLLFLAIQELCLAVRRAEAVTRARHHCRRRSRGPIRADKRRRVEPGLLLDHHHVLGVEAGQAERRLANACGRLRHRLAVRDRRRRVRRMSLHDAVELALLLGRVWAELRAERQRIACERRRACRERVRPAVGGGGACRGDLGLLCCRLRPGQRRRRDRRRLERVGAPRRGGVVGRGCRRLVLGRARLRLWLRRRLWERGEVGAPEQEERAAGQEDGDGDDRHQEPRLGPLPWRPPLRVLRVAPRPDGGDLVLKRWDDDEERRGRLRRSRRRGRCTRWVRQ